MPWSTTSTLRRVVGVEQLLQVEQLGRLRVDQLLGVALVAVEAVGVVGRPLGQHHVVAGLDAIALGLHRAMLPQPARSRSGRAGSRRSAPSPVASLAACPVSASASSCSCRRPSPTRSTACVAPSATRRSTGCRRTSPWCRRSTSRVDDAGRGARRAAGGRGRSRARSTSSSVRPAPSTPTRAWSTWRSGGAGERVGRAGRAARACAPAALDRPARPRLRPPRHADHRGRRPTGSTPLLDVIGGFRGSTVTVDRLHLLQQQAVSRPTAGSRSPTCRSGRPSSSAGAACRSSSPRRSWSTPRRSRARSPIAIPRPTGRDGRPDGTRPLVVVARREERRGRRRPRAGRPARSPSSSRRRWSTRGDGTDDHLPRRLVVRRRRPRRLLTAARSSW